MRKGQSGVEFIVLLGFLILVFMGFAYIIQERIVEQQQANQRDLYIQLADKIERELLLASRVRPGYGREFEIPVALNGQDYNVTLEGKDTLVIRSNGEEYIRFLSVNVSLSPTGEPRLLVNESMSTPKIIIRKNMWGDIYINRTCAAKGLTYRNCPVTQEE